MYSRKLLLAIASATISAVAIAQPPGRDQGMRRADTDQDGKVSYEELLVLRPELTREAFDKLDKNQDGVLSAADRSQRGREGMEGEGPDPRLERLRSADTDNSGDISATEFAAAFPNAPDDAFAAADRNGDGKLDRHDGPPRGPGHPDGPGDSDGARGERNPAALFSKADSDGDGKLTLAEAQAEMPRMSPKYFARLDANKDGSLTVDEMKTARRPPVERPANEPEIDDAERDGAIRFLVEKADSNRDGVVTYEEIVAAKPGFPKANFDRLDKNGDGKITADE